MHPKHLRPDQQSNDFKTNLKKRDETGMRNKNEQRIVI